MIDPRDDDRFGTFTFWKKFGRHLRRGGVGDGIGFGNDRATGVRAAQPHAMPVGINEPAAGIRAGGVDPRSQFRIARRQRREIRAVLPPKRI